MRFAQVSVLASCLLAGCSSRAGFSDTLQPVSTAGDRAATGDGAGDGAGDGSTTGDAKGGDLAAGDTALAGDHARGDAFFGDNGDSVVGDSLLGDTLMGDTLMGDTVMGDTLMGDTMMGDPGPPCRDTAAASSTFGPTVELSDPMGLAFFPSITILANVVLVAWHDPNGLFYTRIDGGCVGPIETLADPDGMPRQASVATEGGQFVIAYEVIVGPDSLIRAVRVDPNGGPHSAVMAISPATGTFNRPQVASNGAGLAYSWLTPTGHMFRIDSLLETVAPTSTGYAVGTVQATAPPRLAYHTDGTLHVAFRDGPTSTDFEVYTSRRPPMGAFEAPINLSVSAMAASDEPSIAVDSAGNATIAWVEQFMLNFETVFSLRPNMGAPTGATPYGVQSSSAYAPSVSSSGAAVWVGPGLVNANVYFATPIAAPVGIVPGELGGSADLVEMAGAIHLTFVAGSNPRVVRYGLR